MMGLKKDEVDKLVARMLSGDQEAFVVYQKEFGAIITLHAKKWFHSVQNVTGSLYDFEDISQEIWEYVWSKLPKYDSTRSTMVTWLYLMCDFRPGRIYREYSAQKRSPNHDEGEWLVSLNDEVNIGKDDGEMELIDFIADPAEALESKAMTDVELFEYIYALKYFISKLNENQRLVYLHQIKGLTQANSCKILGLSQCHISRMREDILSKLLRYKDNLPNIDYKKADQFAIMLLGPMEDDMLAEKLSCDLAIVKICREILAMVDLYRRQEDIDDQC